MKYIIGDSHMEIEDDEVICQKCGHDNQDDITQCEVCGRYFCDFCMSEKGDICKSCSDEY